MTRDQQIREALELLAPPAAEREECRHEICLALDMVEHSTAVARSFRAGRSKKKSGLLSYHAALRRLRIAFNSLDPALKPWFNLAPRFTTRTAIEKEIDKAESILAQPSAPPRRDGGRNKAAAKAAYNLLTWRGHTATVTRGGRWEKLAKILAGGREKASCITHKDGNRASHCLGISPANDFRSCCCRESTAWKRRHTVSLTKTVTGHQIVSEKVWKVM